MATTLYKTVSGDTWDKIAKEVYGSESYMSYLMANNQSLISYFVFPADIYVKVVDLPEESSNLPEWRD